MKVPRFRLAGSERINDALVAAARVNHFVSGPEIAAFEQQLAQLFGYRHCLTTINGFAALHLAIEAANPEHRDVILPAASTCFAVLNSVLAAGCRPQCVDLTRDARIDVASVANIRPAAGAVVLAPSHFGIPAPVEQLQALGCTVIEDAAQAFHSALHTQHRADLLVLSFYPSKHVNAIDGGALLTNDDAFAERARDRVYYDTQRQPDGVVRFNYRLPSLHAAVGLNALEHVENHAQTMKRLEQCYLDATQGYRFVHLVRDPQADAATILARFVLVFDEFDLAQRFLAGMTARAVGCASEMLSLVEQNRLGHEYPGADKLVRHAVSIPYYPALTDAEVSWVVQALRQTLKELEQ